MYDLILQLVFMAGLGAMFYLVARAVPRVSDGEAHLYQHGKLDAWLGSLPLEQVDAFLNSSLEKALRKAKIGVLKVDNLVTAYLNKVKSANGKPANGNGSLLAGGMAETPPSDETKEGEGGERKNGNRNI